MTYTSPSQRKEKIVALVDTLCSTVLKLSTTRDTLGDITNESLMVQWKEDFLKALEPERDPWVNYSRPLSTRAIEAELVMITMADSKHFVSMLSYLLADVALIFYRVSSSVSIPLHRRKDGLQLWQLLTPVRYHCSAQQLWLD